MKSENSRNRLPLLKPDRSHQKSIDGRAVPAPKGDLLDWRQLDPAKPAVILPG